MARKRRRRLDDDDSDSLAVQPPPCPALRPNKGASGTDGKTLTYDTFHPFQRLPPELRLYIWREVAQDATVPFHPLRVRLYRGKERIAQPSSSTRRNYTTRDVLRLASMPELSQVTQRRRDLLRVCREARSEVLKLWDSSVPVERNGILRFSFKFDIVYLDIVNPAVMQDLIDCQADDDLPAFTSTIGHLGFDMMPAIPLWLLGSVEDLEPKASLILCFPKLHSLSLISFNAFQNEIDWASREDSNWIISRTRSHKVYLRSFPALEHCNYTAQSAIGRRVAGPREKHDCAICTIHKCVYINQIVGRQARTSRLEDLADMVGLTPADQARLRGIKHHNLIASSPVMQDRIPAYKHNTACWWINRPAVRRRMIGESADDDGYVDKYVQDGHQHNHGQGQGNASDDGNGDEDDDGGHSSEHDDDESDANDAGSEDDDDGDDGHHDHYHGHFGDGFHNHGHHGGHHHDDSDDEDNIYGT